MGTLAVGSIIITICRMIRWVLEYFDTKLKQYNNEVATGVIKCCKCCFWVLEKFLKFINKNAYIMCAIHGKSFFPSARDAFSLLMRNILRVFVLDQVKRFLFLCSFIAVQKQWITVQLDHDSKYRSMLEDGIPFFFLILSGYRFASPYRKNTCDMLHRLGYILVHRKIFDSYLLASSGRSGHTGNLLRSFGILCCLFDGSWHIVPMLFGGLRAQRRDKGKTLLHEQRPDEDFTKIIALVETAIFFKSRQ